MKPVQITEAELEVMQLLWDHSPQSAPELAAKLAERIGMKREAHLRQDWWSKGEWTDTLVFAMLASDRVTA